VISGGSGVPASPFAASAWDCVRNKLSVGAGAPEDQLPARNPARASSLARSSTALTLTSVFFDVQVKEGIGPAAGPAASPGHRT